MKKILIVEDELVVRSIYRRKFENSGYQVETAEEGAAALNLVPNFKPDAIQLDIMMPGMDGVEVIKQIRSWPDFKTVPILVISSFYRPDLAREAWKAGASKCVSKMDCTPNLALELVEQMLNGAKLGVSAQAEGITIKPAESPWEDATQIIARPSAPTPVATSAANGSNGGGTAATAIKLAMPPPAPKLKAPTTLPSFAKPPDSISGPDAPKGGTAIFAKPEQGTRITTRPSFALQEAQKSPKDPAPFDAPKIPLTPARAETPIAAADLKPLNGDAARGEIREEFARRSAQIQTDLRERMSALAKSKSTNDQLNLLRELEATVSALASLAGVTGYSRISHLAGALDALIKDIHKKPAQMTNSVLRTIAHACDCLNLLFRDLDRTPRDVPQSTLILGVDDEPISRRTLSVALSKAGLRCLSVEDPKAALALAKENAFDLVFLDAEMPGMNGFELCGELRKLPTNKTTPVIFVTSLTKFEVRAQSSLAGGNDLIAKPFLMMELAVKSLTYLLKPSSIVDTKSASN